MRILRIRRLLELAAIYGAVKYVKNQGGVRPALLDVLDRARDALRTSSMGSAKRAAGMSGKMGEEHEMVSAEEVGGDLQTDVLPESERSEFATSYAHYDVGLDDDRRRRH